MTTGLRASSFARASLLIATTVALVLASTGCGGPTSASSSTTTSASTARMVVPVVATAIGGLHVQQLVNAKVSVAVDGKVVGSKNTGRAGVAVIDVPAGSSSFEVTASDGVFSAKHTNWSWNTYVTGYHSPRTICVNGLTTVIARLHADQPDWSSSQLAHAVRHYFSLPSWYDLMCGPTSSVYFDSSTFTTLATARGGIQAYASSLASQISAHPSASTRRFYQSPTTSAQVNTAAKNLPSTPTLTSTPVNWPSAVGNVGTGVYNSLGGIFQAMDNDALLGPALQSWVAGAGAIYTFIEALAGNSPAPTPTIQDVLTALQQDFQALDNSIQALQTSLNEIQVQITEVEATSLSNGQSNAVLDAGSLASAVATDHQALLTLSGLQEQISCGDDTNPTTSTSACTNPQSLAKVCPQGTLLTWNPQTSKVVYPTGWTGTSSSAIGKDCINYSELAFGEGGFVALVSGNSAKGGNPNSAIGFSSLGQLSTYVSGSGSTPGIVQYTSMQMTQLSRFIDSQASAVTQATFNYYLSVYDEMILCLLSYVALIQEPVANWQGQLNAQPTVGQFASADPTVVPPGTVLDTTTGVMWEQQIGANATCGNYGQGEYVTLFYCQPPANTLAGTPSTLTPTSITMNPSSGPTSAPIISMNVAPNAVTPTNPLTITAAQSTGSAFGDWYAAEDAQLTGLYNNAQPASGQAAGDWARSTPESSPAGPGMTTQIFGSSNGNFGGNAGGGIQFGPMQSPQLQYVGKPGHCSIDPIQCYTASIVPTPQYCSLAGNPSCGTPSAPFGPGILFDLNNGSSNSSVFAVLPQAGNNINNNVWNSLTGCTNTNGNPFSSSYEQCDPGDTVTYPGAFYPTLNNNGFVAWFYRNPQAGASTSECYYYLPPSVTPAAGNTSACASPAAAAGHNGIFSQSMLGNTG